MRNLARLFLAIVAVALLAGSAVAEEMTASDRPADLKTAANASDIQLFDDAFARLLTPESELMNPSEEPPVLPFDVETSLCSIRCCPGPHGDADCQAACGSPDAYCAPTGGGPYVCIDP